jgi:tRNA-binding EMAP/Myf-like protein
LHINEGSAQTKSVKVIDVETGDVVKDVPSSAYFTNELKTAIESMKGITVKVNPLPKKGYLILIQPTASLKVKNKWYDGIVSEGMIVYSKEDSPRLILFTDENKPLFFEMSYDPKNLIQTLGIQ